MTAKYRLAIDVRMLRSSGIGTYLQHLLPAVLDCEGLRPLLLITRSSDSHDFTARDLAVIPYDAPLHSLASQFAYPRFNADLLWFPNYNAPLFHRERLVATVHDIYHLVGSRSLPKLAYARLLFNQLRKKSSAILCVSDFTANELMRKAGFSASQLRITKLGVDPFWSQPFTPTQHRDRPYFLAVGNLKPHKNLHRLIAAFKSLTATLPHDLIIVGKMTGFIDSAKDLFEHNDDARIIFLGQVDNEVLRELYAGATALVFPSLYEGFGLPPLEAMAANCPALCSHAAAIPEVCADAALYFDPLDTAAIAACMTKIAVDHALADDLRARGAQRVQRFSWKNTAAQTLEVLKEQLGN